MGSVGDHLVAVGEVNAFEILSCPLDVGPVKGEEVALLVHVVFGVAEHDFVPRKAWVQDQFPAVIHGELVGERVPERVVLGGLYKAVAHGGLRFAGHVHHGDVGSEVRVQHQTTSVFVQVVVRAVGQVHPHHGTPLPHIDVKHAVHRRVDFRIGTRVQIVKVIHHRLQVHVGHQFSFEAGGAELVVDTIRIEEADHAGIFHVDFHAGHASGFGLEGGKTQHRAECGEDEEDAEDACDHDFSSGGAACAGWLVGQGDRCRRHLPSPGRLQSMPSSLEDGI